MKSKLAFLLLLPAFLSAQDTLSPRQLVVKYKEAFSSKGFKYYRDGKLFSGKVIEYYPDGKLKYQESYKNGTKEGFEKGWWKNGGQAYVVRYVDGVPELAVSYFHKNGRLAVIANAVALTKGAVAIVGKGVYKELDSIPHFKGLVPHDYLLKGNWTSFYETGVIQTTGFYLPEVTVEFSRVIETNENGEIVAEYIEQSVSEGTKDGRWAYFDKYGKLLRLEFYDRGKLLRAKEFD